MKILIDTDIGSDIDDALALLLLLHLPDIKIVGLTTVYGNVGIRAKVAKKILEAKGLDVPVVAGEMEPLHSTMPIWYSGTEGVDVLTASETIADLDEFGIERGADDFLIDTAQAHPNEIVLVCLGALTNLAQAIEKCPSICRDFKQVFFMGGGITYRMPIPPELIPGNRYQAEPSHNVRCDVRAAQIVFESDLPIHVLTNDVTTLLWWDGPAVQALLNATEPPETEIVGRMLRVWLDYRSLNFLRQVTGTCPHDPLTAAEAAGHKFVTYQPGQMTITPDGSTSFIPDPTGRHHLATSVRSGEFLKWMSKQLLP